MTIRHSFTYLLMLLTWFSPVSPLRAEEAGVSFFSERFAETEQRKNLREFAQCIVKRFPDEVQGALRADAFDEEGRRAYPHLIDLGCFKGAWFRKKALTIDYGFLAVAAAEYLLIADYGGQPLPDLSKVAPLTHPNLPKLDLETIPKIYRTIFMRTWAYHDVDVAAECVVRSAPAEVIRLLKVIPDSPEEQTEITTFAGRFAACRAPENVMSQTPYELRGALAYNFYMLLDAANPVTHKR